MCRPRSRTRRTPSSREMTPAATSAEYWPIECPAANAGVGAERPAAAHRSRNAASIAIEAASRAGWAFSVRSSRSAGPSQASALIGSPRAASAVANTAAAAAEDAASSRPMPTDCEPCPGKTKAILDIATQRSPAGCGRGRFPCMLACMTEPRGARSTTRPAPTRAIAQRFEADLSATVLAAGSRITNVRQISERVAMGRALWRELVIGFASQLGDLRLGFTQLAALYVLADGSTLTIGELAESINRSPSATSRLIDGLVKRRLVERRAEEEDRRQKTLRLTPRGHAVLRVVDRARAEQFLSAVRPMPTAERAIVAMGVAALATHAISRRGRLIRGTREPGS